MISAKSESVQVPRLAKEASTVKCTPQTFFPTNSATSVIEEKIREKKKGKYWEFFFPVISVVKATAKSSCSRLQQKLNTLLCWGLIQWTGQSEREIDLQTSEMDLNKTRFSQWRHALFSENTRTQYRTPQAYVAMFKSWSNESCTEACSVLLPFGVLELMEWRSSSKVLQPDSQ